MVRDPIEKAISWYYYIRSAPFLDNVKRKINPNTPSSDANWLEKVKYMSKYLFYTRLDFITLLIKIISINQFFFLIKADF